MPGATGHPVPDQVARPDKPTRRILVVDDDEAVRTMVVRVLSEAGYAAFAAADCDEAVRAFCRVNFDLALLDVAMPGGDGWMTLAQLHARDAEFPVIIITAWPHQQATAWTSGAIGCFEKPLDFNDLLAAIARVFLSADPTDATDPAVASPTGTPSIPPHILTPPYTRSRCAPSRP